MSQYPPPSWEVPSPAPGGPGGSQDAPPAWGTPPGQAPAWGATPAGGTAQNTWEQQAAWSPSGQGFRVPPPPQPPRTDEPFLLRKAVLVPLTALIAFAGGFAVSSVVTTVEALQPAIDDIQQAVEGQDTGSLGGFDGESGPAAGGTITGTVTSDDMEFTAITVYPDVAGDFTVDATVEHTGDVALEGASLTAEVLADDQVLGTADTTVSLEPGDTTTVTLVGFDDYEETWDGVRFSVDR